MIKYSSVIIVDKNDNLVLVKKNRPEWQKGRLNFVGGHVEKDETYHLAAYREVKEETGLVIKPSQTEVVGSISDSKNFFLQIFLSHIDDAFDARTMTDEPIEIMSVDDFLSLNTSTVMDYTQTLVFNSLKVDEQPLNIVYY